MDISQEIIDKINLLQEKYKGVGQDINSYLEGLLHSKSLSYWDYIHLDTLLSLQNPKTDFPDEVIFIGYHQITEIYFKLILHEIYQINDSELPDAEIFTLKMRRINGYLKHLIISFEIMVDGMEQDQFLKFRMSLLPASGFQSAQYRMVEILSTQMIQLVNQDNRQILEDKSLSEKYNYIYWKNGNRELSNGKKTLTLKMFEEKYDKILLEIVNSSEKTNLYTLFLNLYKSKIATPSLIEELQTFDLYFNVYWPLSHFKSAVKYLQREPEVIKATGGTNWQQYLPPKNQKVISFPMLWSDQEKEDWGKTWSLSLFKDEIDKYWDIKR